jgi:LppP/LprE lipoprotein
VIKRTSLVFAPVVAAIVLAPLGGAASRNAGDLRAAATVVKEKGYRPDMSTWDSSFKLNVLIGTFVNSADGYNQRAFFFFGRRYLGTDAIAPSARLDEIWRDDKTIALLYILYRGRDALCCPTGGGAIVRFRWNGTRLVALDRIPPTRGSVHR